MKHIKTFKVGNYFSFPNGNKTYKVTRFSSNRKYMFYVDNERNEYSLDTTQDYYLVNQ